MEKESTVGQMEQNLKVILKMTRRKDLGHSIFPVEIYLRGCIGEMREMVQG